VIEEDDSHQPLLLSGELPPFPEAAWRGVFEAWRRLVDHLGESPRSFHFANMLALVAAELGDRARFDEGTGPYTNFFIFCCGGTGTKKSTASDLVEEYIANSLRDRAHHQMTSVSSAEGLIRTLAQKKNVLIRYDEIKDLFATAARSGNRLEPILNKAFGLLPVAAIVKKAQDSITAEDYYLNLILNGTPEHVRLDLSETFFSGGMLNRFVIFGGEATGIAKPIMGTPDQAAVLALATRIADIRDEWQRVAAQRASVRVGMSPEAEAMHAAWYSAHTLRQQNLSDMETKPLTRLDTYVKKLGMIYCMTEVDPAPYIRITEDQMNATLQVVTYCQESMMWITRGWSGAKTVSQQSEKIVEQRVEAYLQRKGCMTERELYRQLHLSHTDAVKALNTLGAAGMLNMTMGRPRMLHYAPSCRCFDEVPE
jgi:hypothetical protein